MKRQLNVQEALERVMESDDSEHNSDEEVSKTEDDTDDDEVEFAPESNSSDVH